MYFYVFECIFFHRKSFNYRLIHPRCKPYPYRPFIPEEWESRLANQDWKGLEIRAVKEGKGVFACDNFKKNEVVCNYGGKFLDEQYAKKYLLPFEEKCNYLLEFNEQIDGCRTKFYLNHDASTQSFGKYINHSKLHPNLDIKIYSTKDKKLDVIFRTTKKISKGTQLVWNYGKNFSGVKDCVDTCLICQKRISKTNLSS